MLLVSLEPVPPDKDNSTVVHKPGNNRYAYKLSSENYVKNVLIDARELLMELVLVVDPNC